VPFLSIDSFWFMMIAFGRRSVNLFLSLWMLLCVPVAKVEMLLTAKYVSVGDE
jgi:hypothetical protein